MTPSLPQQFAFRREVRSPNRRMLPASKAANHTPQLWAAFGVIGKGSLEATVVNLKDDE